MHLLAKHEQINALRWLLYIILYYTHMYDEEVKCKDIVCIRFVWKGGRKNKIKKSLKIVNNDESFIAVLCDMMKKLLFSVILTISTATLSDKAINYWCCIYLLCLSTQHQFFFAHYSYILLDMPVKHIFPPSAYIKIFSFFFHLKHLYKRLWKGSLKLMLRFNNFWHFSHQHRRRRHCRCC